MRILIFGDSIAVGAFDTEQHGWVGRLAMYQYRRILKSSWTEGDSVVNVSIAGDTSADVLRRVEIETQHRQWEDEPFTSILAIGTNDAAQVRGKPQVSIEQFATNVQEILQILGRLSERVIVLGLPPVFEELSSPWCFDTTADWQNTELTKYDAELHWIAQEKGILFIPMQDVLDRNSDQHLPEGLHPNAEGHRLIYERVKAELTQANIL